MVFYFFLAFWIRPNVPAHNFPSQNTSTNNLEIKSSRGGSGGKCTTMFTQVVTYMNLKWIESRLGQKYGR